MTAPLIVVTDRLRSDRPLAEVIAAAVDGGARLVALHEPDLRGADRAALAAALTELLAPVGGRLIEVDRELRRCHSPVEAAQSAAEFVTLSPIYASGSKPGYGPALGPGTLGGTGRPTYALGGVDTPDRAAACVRAGAAGVAVMGAIARSADPGRTTRELLEVLR